MLVDLSIRDFLDKTGSAFPVPGGGSVAALSAALAASLTEMVANMTIGKKGYEAVEGEMKRVAEDAIRFKQKFVSAIDEDANAYNSVISAMRLTGVTEEEKQNRQERIQDGLKQAALVPMSVAEEAVKVMTLARMVVSKGCRKTVTEGAVSFLMARTAALAALCNVKINLASIKDEVFVNDISYQIKILGEKIEKEKDELI